MAASTTQDITAAVDEFRSSFSRRRGGFKCLAMRLWKGLGGVFPKLASFDRGCIPCSGESWVRNSSQGGVCFIILSCHTSVCYYLILSYQCVLLSYPITPVCYYLILSYQFVLLSYPIIPVCVIVLSYHTSELLSHPITPVCYYLILSYQCVIILSYHPSATAPASAVVARVLYSGALYTGAMYALTDYSP